MEESSNSVVSAPQLRGNESKDSWSRSRRRTSRIPTNKCSCGQIICNVPGNIARPVSPRHQSVFDRLYRDRIEKEIRRRELARKLVENEARDYTYMPVTNNVRRQLNESSSLISIKNRELKVEKAREQFKKGKICVECLKKVEIGTGTYLMEAMMGAEEVSAQHSKQGSFAFGTDMHPPREIIVTDPPATEKPKSRSRSFLRRSSKDEVLFIAPPALVTQESRNDESTPRKATLPPRAPYGTGAFSFDIVSTISSLGSVDSGSRTSLVVPSIHTRHASYGTPKLENTIQKEVSVSVEGEMREEAESKETMLGQALDDGSKTTESSTSSCGTPLRLLSYLEVESLKSVPFNEKSEKMGAPTSNASLDTNDSNAQTGDSPAPKSAYSLSSILDRDSFMDEKVNPDSNDEVEREAADLAYVGCEMDPTELKCIDPCDNKKSGIVQPQTNNSPTNESFTLPREKSMNGSPDRCAVEERGWIVQLIDCPMCEKSVPNMLPGSQHDLKLALSHSASDEAEKKSMEGSTGVSDSYSTKYHSVDLTPPYDWDNRRKDELMQAPPYEMDGVYQLATCASPSRKSRVAVREQSWLDQSLDLVTEFATCGMLK